MSKINATKGQVLPVLLAVITLAITAILLTHRVNKAITQETRLVSAADAAAYSAAVWTARRLNLIAYTNRAMMANHIAVGHLVAYISWLRYVDEGATRLARYTRYLPYVNTATEVARRIARTGLISSERMSWGYINGVDTLHRLMQIAQLDARRQINTSTIKKVMQRTADQYDDTFRVNETRDLRHLPAPYSGAARAMLTTQRLSAFARLQTAKPGRDEGVFTDLLTRTINHDRNLSQWLRGQERSGWPDYAAGGRDWHFRLPWIIQFRKQGVTNRAPISDAGGWRSRDRLQVRTWDFGKDGWGWSGWRTLARGDADADRLANGYRGVQRYTRLRQGGKTDYRFRIPALLTVPIPGGEKNNAMQSHLSMGEVAYRIPNRCSRNCPQANDPATLFNPYWEARLTTTSMPGLQ